LDLDQGQYGSILKPLCSESASRGMAGACELLTKSRCGRYWPLPRWPFHLCWASPAATEDLTADPGIGRQILTALSTEVERSQPSGDAD